MPGTWEQWSVWVIFITLWLSVCSWVDHFRIKKLEKQIQVLESRR